MKKPRAKVLAILWADGRMQCALVEYKHPRRLAVEVRTRDGQSLVFEHCDDLEHAAQCAARLQRIFAP
jgi:hypothetical protein